VAYASASHACTCIYAYIENPCAGRQDRGQTQRIQDRRCRCTGRRRAVRTTGPSNQALATWCVAVSPPRQHRGCDRPAQWVGLLDRTSIWWRWVSDVGTPSDKSTKERGHYQPKNGAIIGSCAHRKLQLFRPKRRNRSPSRSRETATRARLTTSNGHWGLFTGLKTLSSGGRVALDPRICSPNHHWAKAKQS